MAQDIENNSEQFEKIKEFVQRNKKLIIGLVVALLIILIGNDFYQSKQEQNTGEASQLFQKLLISKTTDIENLKSIADDLKDHYAKTPYAARAQIIFVKTILKNDAVDQDVKDRLHWVSQNAVEPSIKSLSVYYLGLISLSEDDLEGAKNFSELIKTKGFVGFKFDLQGDIAKIEGDIDKAKELYGKAISSFSPQSDFSRVIEYKLQNL
ncbi:tetratricopeptide repeat protein [Methylophilaceae bacterium]|nr:tetratricopeptide repeat protein [Methylophilaceae bacterium]